MKEVGQEVEIPKDQEVSVDKLVEPSIFDDQKITSLKQSLSEITNYIKDSLVDMTEFEKIKKAQSKTTQEIIMPKSFGEVPKDADTFKPVKLKSKKRPLE